MSRVSIDIEDVEAKSIITKSQIGDDMYVANPYIGCSHGCIYCYAVFMRRFTNHMNDKWGSFVDIKHWKPLTERQKLKYRGKWIMISSTTDAYQKLTETDSKRTQALLMELKDAGINISILTKSNLILRDLELLKGFSGKVAIGVSINTIDDELRSEQDRASTIMERLEVLKTFHKNGFYCYCFIAPSFPVLSDVLGVMNMVKRFVNEIWIDSLNLVDSNVKSVVYRYIETKHPELKELYVDIYTNKNQTYFKDLKKTVRDWCKQNNAKYVQNELSGYNRKKLTILDFIE